MVQILWIGSLSLDKWTTQNLPKFDKEHPYDILKSRKHRVTDLYFDRKRPDSVYILVHFISYAEKHYPFFFCKKKPYPVVMITIWYSRKFSFSLENNNQHFKVKKGFLFQASHSSIPPPTSITPLSFLRELTNRNLYCSLLHG